MASKTDYVRFLCDLVGKKVARIIDARDGWPGIIELQLSTGPRRFSAHVGHIHSMSRKPYEFRFQNPGKSHPMMSLPGTQALLLGIWDQDQPSVLVAASPDLRLGDMTRFSVLFPERLFREAQAVGWAEPYRNNKGDLHWSFLPQLLPTFAELQDSRLYVDARDLQTAIAGTGLVEKPDDPAATRARRIATRLARDARFGQLVVDAYHGRCAMCGLNLGLVSGAHILPVSAPGSSDEVTNGIALCDNHHRAFDKHRIWVDPRKRTLSIHPSIRKHASNDPLSQAFVSSLRRQVAGPVDPAQAPQSRAFEERYAYFDGSYHCAQ